MIRVSDVVPVNRGEDVNDINARPYYQQFDSDFGIKDELTNSRIPTFGSGAPLLGGANLPPFVALAPCVVSESLQLTRVSQPVYVESEYGMKPNQSLNGINTNRPLPPLSKLLNQY